MPPVASTVSTSNLLKAPKSADGFQVGQSTSDLVAFYGVTPIVQPASPAGNVHTVTAGSTTAVYVNTSFDGGITGTAYTLGDIVAALKNLGLIAV